jgi:gliding motility-associated-like protein
MTLNKIIATLLLSILSFIAFAQDETLSGPAACNAAAITGTWTVPCGVTSVTIEVYGAGGGGGGGGGGSNGGFFNTRGGGGAGGGGFTTITINVTPGSTFNYTIGSGGCGGSNGSDGSSGGGGTNGGNSTFTGTTAGGTPVSLTANGGARGTGGSGTEGSPGSGGAGGSASGGTTNTTGTSGNNGSGGSGGAGGAGAGPSGGAGGASTNQPGAIYGGGGAGGGDSQGGRGAQGVIFITYVTSNPLPVPTITSTPPTCTLDGTSTISNYDAAYTYTFSPTGPSAGAGGAITNMTTGTSYTVIATDAGGCTSTPSASFSNAAATPVPVPTVTTTQPTCSADGSSTITNYNGALTYTFNPTGPTAGAGGAISGMTPGTSYTVIASDAGGCSSTPSSPFSNAAQFPPAVAAISGSLSYCTGGNTTLTASGGVSYVWSNAETTAAVTVTQGSYTVTVTDANGCTASENATVTETTNLTVIIDGDLSYCPGGNTTLTANGGTSFSWSNSETTASITVTAGTYSVTASDITGCTGTASVTVTEFTPPVVNISGTLSYCVGANTLLTASGADSYLWSNGATTDTVTVTQGNYTVTGTDANGCTASATATVSENNPPVVAFSGSTSYCAGSNTTVTASGGDTYLWNTTETTASITVTQGTYYVTVTDAIGCTNTDSITVTELPNPVADFSVSPDCAGQPIPFTNNSSPSTSNYVWDFGNGSTSTAPDPSETFSQGGNYTITLIVTDGGCSDTATQTLDVYDQPVAGFTAEPLRAIKDEDTVAFTNTSTGADLYSWDFGDGGTSNDVEPTHIYSEDGFYTVTLIAANQQGCIDTATRTNYIEVFDKPILWVPNAFSPNGDGENDVFFVYGSGYKEMYLTIFDRWGTQMFYSENLKGGWTGSFDGKEAEAGVYVYYIKTVFNDLTINTFKGSVTLLR